MKKIESRCHKIYDIVICLFENLLLLAYKLPVKKWQIKIETDKKKKKNIDSTKKKEIQDQFKKKSGIVSWYIETMTR